MGSQWGGGPKFRAFFPFSYRQVRSFFFLVGVFSLNCGPGAWPWTSQTVRLGFSRVILCEPWRPVRRGNDPTKSKHTIYEVVALNRDHNSTRRPQRAKTVRNFWREKEKRAKCWEVRERWVRGREVPGKRGLREGRVWAKGGPGEDWPKAVLA